MPGKKQSVAYHEAGHAIADTHQRVRVKYCTIIPEDGCAGASVLCTPLREVASRARKEAAIISLFAGEIAQRKFDKHSVRHDHGEGDRESVWHIASPMCGSDEEVEAYTHWLWVRARNLVDRPHIWNAITLLAEKLCADKTVDGKTVRRIYRDAVRTAVARHATGK